MDRAARGDSQADHEGEPRAEVAPHPGHPLIIPLLATRGRR